MTNERKALAISLVLLAVSTAVSALLYFVFHIVFIFLIFIPPVIYYLLSKRDNNGDTSA
jgi:hypothetical protein